MAQGTQEREEALHDSQVYRVSGQEGQPESFYCTLCNVHISTMDAAEGHTKSPGHLTKLKAVSSLPQGGASPSVETNEGPTVF